MTVMLEHDARASGRALLNGDAQAYATNARTDVLTQNQLQREVFSRSITRAKTTNRFRAEVASDPRFATCPHGLSSCRCCSATTRRTSVPLLDQTSNAQGFTVATLTVEAIQRLAACNNTAARRTQTRIESASYDTLSRSFKLSDERACSPLAGWHGKSNGSDPLRPPTTARRPVVQGRLSLTAVPDSSSGYRRGSVGHTHSCRAAETAYLRGMRAAS